MFTHKHNYEVVESFKFEEKSTALSVDQTMWLDHNSKQELSKRGVISVCRCTLCGHVKHIKTSL